MMFKTVLNATKNPSILKAKQQKVFQKKISASIMQMQYMITARNVTGRSIRKKGLNQKIKALRRQPVKAVIQKNNLYIRTEQELLKIRR